MAKFASVPTIFYLYGLDRDPYDNKLKYYMFGPKTEWMIGQAIFEYGLKNETKLLKNGQIEILLNDILQHLLKKNDIPNRQDWHVHVSDDLVVNAYAMPGGNIVFNIGICQLFDNVDQIAMVMGHEISHVLLRHSLRQASKKLINLFAMLFGFISLEFGFLYAYGIEKMESVYKLKQSRVHESRADENGLKLLQRAGYSIGEGPNMILKFQELELERDKDFQKLNAE